MTTIDQLQAHGIPVTAPANGGPVETKTVVHDVDQLRSLLDLGLDQQGRQAHYEALFNGIEPAATGGQAAAADGGAPLSQRIAAHVVGNADLSDEDRAAIAPVFPLTAHVTAAPGPITVNSRYDLSTPDGSVRIVSFTDVTLEQGGYFVCESTPLSFTCTTLTRIGTSGSSAADFNILGKTGATPATPPTPGAAGQAAPGAPGECSSAGIAGQGGGNGSSGAAGTPGTAGPNGNPGTPSMQATITIKNALTASELIVYSQSGPGGQGGIGGAGGLGQQGGNGGNGDHLWLHRKRRWFRRRRRNGRRRRRGRQRRQRRQRGGQRRDQSAHSPGRGQDTAHDRAGSPRRRGPAGPRRRRRRRRHRRRRRQKQRRRRQRRTREPRRHRIPGPARDRVRERRADHRDGTLTPGRAAAHPARGPARLPYVQPHSIRIRTLIGHGLAAIVVGHHTPIRGRD